MPSGNHQSSSAKRGPQHEILDGYQVGAEIGKGSFANVYKGIVLVSKRLHKTTAFIFAMRLGRHYLTWMLK